MGWAGPSQPGQVTGPSHWPAGQRQMKHAWSGSTRASMHSAKVINLPSHSATLHSNWMCKETKEKWLTCSLETEWMVAARWPSSAYRFPSCFPLLLCPLFPFFLCFSLLSRSLRWRTEDGAGFSLQIWVWVLCCVFALCFSFFTVRSSSSTRPLFLAYSSKSPSWFCFFLCSFLRFLVFRLGLASVLPLPVFVFHPCSWPVRPSLFSGFFYSGFYFSSFLWFSVPQIPHWFCFSPLIFRPLVLGFLLPFIEKFAPQPVLPLQDCYSNHERDHGQETWSMICCRFPVESASSAQT